jgi:hypothetical protein
MNSSRYADVPIDPGGRGRGCAGQRPVGDRGGTTRGASGPCLDVVLLPELPHQVVARLTGTEPLLVQLSRSPAGQLTGRLPGRTSTPRCSVPDLDGDGPAEGRDRRRGQCETRPGSIFAASEGNNTKFQRKPIKGVYLHEDSWARNLIPQR